MKRLVLLGAGHAHMVALRQFAREPLPETELVVVSPSRWQYYSGMIPGWLAGHYRFDQCRVLVEPTVIAAGGRLVLDRAVELRAAEQEVVLASGERVPYDLLSVDVGSASDSAVLNEPDSMILGVKPVERFAEDWPATERSLRARARPRIVVLGGGAGGAEIAMALARRSADCDQAGVVLVAGSNGVVPGFRPRFRRLVRRALMRCGVDIVEEYGEPVVDGVRLAGGRRMRADAVLVSTGGRALPFLEASGLAVDEAGFVRVDASHRSTSHHNVFVAGDACSRVDQRLDRSGVHAVRAGPILARNLAAAISGKPLVRFYPRRFSLYLLAAGDCTAIGSYGPLTFSGAWVWKWKDRIDRGFVDSFPGA
ncbi:FAD-dependent oxidoreductase [Marinobacter hydrocarbonoclasticus]|uniref:FAD-dependent oxidoreductase n=1 Tax=Marinobacter nauticus TaxID=2743 RepID=UPI001A8F29A8|nr:FAD-dependent oxidoreductase [Marinobacter nauticus]MBN8237582.1 FAD-dependent oxidoreductase [Marinobacter nauticus]